MLGGGVVGGGVYELIMNRYNAKPSNNRPLLITKICVRDLEKPRDFQVRSECTQWTTNPSDLLRDDIDCVVEVAGGCGVAKDVVLQALQLGKPVVTANKALLAEYMTDIQAILQRSDNHHNPTPMGFEAAVCGGIPIIDILQTAYTPDTIQSIQGICNGTTNYMLSAMEQDPSILYDDVLKQAQDLGYAEADPTADVEGHDVRAKIAILAKLAFGTNVSVTNIPCQGIVRITPMDFAYAANHCNNATIKLIGTAALSATNALSVFVTPFLIPRSHPLANVHGVTNCVTVQSQNLNVATYMGPGAGRFPTANSIVADVIRAANQQLPKHAFPASSTTTTNIQLVLQLPDSRFYVRLITTQSTQQVADMAQQYGIGIAQAVTHASNTDSSNKQAVVICCFTTNDKVPHSQVQQFANAVCQSTGDEPLILPILSME
jgi:homoserine dehydrogenase